MPRNGPRRSAKAFMPVRRKTAKTASCISRPREQVPGTLERYYGASDLVLVAVDPVPLGAALKYEPASNGALYPHLYGTLPLTAVRWAKPIRRSADGEFLVPREFTPA